MCVCAYIYKKFTSTIVFFDIVSGPPSISFSLLYELKFYWFLVFTIAFLFSAHFISFRIFFCILSSMVGGDDSPKKSDSIAMVGFHVQEISALITSKWLDGTNYIEWALNTQIKIHVFHLFLYLPGCPV